MKMKKTKVSVELVYIHKSKWPKKVLAKLKELNRIRFEDGKHIDLTPTKRTAKSSRQS